MAQHLVIPGRVVDGKGPASDAQDEAGEIAELRRLGFEVSLRQVVEVSAAREGGMVRIPVDAGAEREASPPPAAKRGTRGARTATPPAEAAPAPAGRSVCEVEFDTGARLWLRPETLYELFGARPDRGAAIEDREDWIIDPTVPGEASTRGVRDTIVSVAMWGVSLAKGVLKGAAIGKPVYNLAESIEQRLHDGRKPGVYTLSLIASEPVLEPSAQIAKSKKPLLVFLHGTLSSATGSFGRLWDSANAQGKRTLSQLAARYGDTAYALEHHTLSASPIANAAMLLDALPDGAELHLVSHSRGGLIGELMCLSGVEDKGTFTASRLAQMLAYKATESATPLPPNIGEAWVQDAGALEGFIAKLYAKQLKVSRFVRVACPSEGTTLAMRKLDLWLSLYRHLIDKAAGAVLGHYFPPAIPLRMLMTLIAQPDAQQRLPGLWSMVPGNPFISLVNLQALTVDADLTVVSGDNKGKRAMAGALEYALNKFFRDQNDYIVNTGSMYGGLPRSRTPRYQLDVGDDVDHFSYFRNTASVRWLAAGLLRADKDEAGFLPIGRAPRKAPYLRAALKRQAPGPRPLVVMLPGIMGSELATKQESDFEQIWMNPGRIALGRLGEIAIGQGEVVATRPLDEYYADFLEFLGETHEVLPFAYDWRLGLMELGRRLGDRIARALDENDRQPSRMPVRIVAHSLGGLVVRAMIAARPDVWKRMTAHADSRVVMLGTPNGGSFEIVRLMLAQSDALQQLAVIDLTRGSSKLLQIITRFPGVLQLLPNAGPEFFSADTWDQLQRTDEVGESLWVLPDKQDLIAAHEEVRQWRSVDLDPARFVYVAGCADHTPSGWVETNEFDEQQGANRRSVAFVDSSRGDGRVLWDTGIPPQVGTWYMHGVSHGDLCNVAEHFDALVELLQTGETTRLFRVPPARRAFAGATRPLMRRDRVDRQPSRDSLVTSLMGQSPRRARRVPVLGKASVSVVHGNLAYARFPVVVGHYAGDTIVGAEDHLDRSLGGLLRRRAALGMYAGAPGSNIVVLQPDMRARPAGAIVVGLGRPDTLSPGSLREGITRAALEYALAALGDSSDRFKPRSEGQPRSAGLSCLLVGSGAGGLTMRNVVCAVLGGIGAANRRLADQQLAAQVWIDEVEFIELWLDRATQAADALELALKDGELGDLFVGEGNPEGLQPLVLLEGQAGLRRVDAEEMPNWWQRMEISHVDDQHALRFVAMTDRARAEVMQVAGQLQTAERFIEQAISNASRDAEISRTLFEMLIPNRMKELAPDRHDVWLLVDEQSAGYPWELLEDRWSQDGKPLAVASGMLRQFKTLEFRERPTASIADAVLVIGNPELPVRNDFPFLELPGAQAEAEEVAGVLEKHAFAVTRRIHTDAGRVLAALHGSGYRILHLAAHGVHEWETVEMRPPAGFPEGRPEEHVRKVSGMVIGDGVFLTPGDVEQMRFVPELVFINCCHLGRVSGASGQSWSMGHKLAANLAAQFIRMGVRAVVAAGWAVDDAAAMTFAVSFYDQLLRGDSYGYAVKHAREITFLQHGGTNTWGAYQCYGDPEWRLRSAPDTRESGRNVPFRSPAQAATELENIASRIAVSNSTTNVSLDQTLALLRKRHPDWLKRAEVAAAAGIALGALERFEEAVEFLDVAIQAKRADVSLRAIEQRANFVVKQALRAAIDGKVKDREAAVAVMRGAIRDVEALRLLGSRTETVDGKAVERRPGETLERLILLGSAWKRIAWISKAGRAQALQESIACYQEANEKANADGIHDANPLTNLLMVRAVGDWFRLKQGAGEPMDVEALAAEGVRWSEQQERKLPDFWSSVAAPDCMLAAALWAGKLDEQAAQIEQSYVRVILRGAGAKEVGSVLEQLDFMAEMARQSVGRKDVAKVLAALRAALWRSMGR
ncbi:MAG TPA: CHAT domain-containing protein [Albitalea sp.]|uniref:DUF7379 domain-containing protein n=1 Tax=Piscinibacter sp. TaxID=1903157 RepID=UPI002ED22007